MAAASAATQVAAAADVAGDDPFAAAVAHWSVAADRTHPAGQLLAERLRTQAERAPTLHRGFMAGKPPYPNAEDLVEGAVIALPMSSFSESYEVAEAFSWSDEDEAAPWHPTVLTLHEGHGLPISLESAFDWQEEWLVEGQFQIVDVRRVPDPEFTDSLYVTAEWLPAGQDGQ